MADPQQYLDRVPNLSLFFRRDPFVSNWREITRSAPFRLQLTSKAILRSDSIIEYPRRPLLVIDGDSFAHRAYHGLPKSIRRHGNVPL